MSYINVAKDFTTAPGGRKRSWGAHSAEEFLETILLPKYIASVTAGEPLCINLDGTAGYAASFLDEAFAGLAVARASENVLDHLLIFSSEEPLLIHEITQYIREAESQPAHEIRDGYSPTPEQAIRAIAARIDGDFDNPELLDYGPISECLEDVSNIANSALIRIMQDESIQDQKKDKGG